MTNHVGAQCQVYVDMSNYTISGALQMAVAAGYAPSIAAANTYRISHDWRPDLRALRSALLWNSARRVARIRCYGSRTGFDGGFWAAVEQSGMEPVTLPRSRGQREKGVDTRLTLDVWNDVENVLQPGDEVTLVSGDEDFRVLVDSVRSRGISARVVFWSTAAESLKASASEFVNLDPHLCRLTLPAYGRRAA